MWNSSSMAPRLVQLALAGLALVGCSGVNSSKGSADSGYWEDVDSGDLDHGDSGRQVVRPEYWTLGAKLSLADDSVAVDLSSLTIELLDVDGESLCSVELGVAEVVPTELASEEWLLTWWSILPGPARSEDDTGVSKCAENLLPDLDPLLVGVGAMHDEIEALLPSRGLPSGTLNGAYASFDAAADPLWVFGVAGPPAAYSGDGSPATEPPLADGMWTVTPLYSFEY